MRAYTDSVATALRDARKVAIVRRATLRCAVPYPLEGWLRRELVAAGAEELQIAHGMRVEAGFSLPEPAAAALRARLDDGGQGRLVWLD